ncbi:MAG TPA: hypothetical protein VGM96_08170 [Reyranella sp.]|jgi:hypothetical protein
MAAKKKSASRHSAAKAKGKKTAKRPAAKKGAAKKAAAKKAAAKKAAAKKAAVRKAVSKRRPAPKKAAAPRRKPVQPPKAPSPALAEVERRIALVQNNLRDLMEQAAATSGSGSEEALSDRIGSQEAELQRLHQERDALAKREGV